MKNAKGSNQYRIKTKYIFWKSVVWLFLALVLLTAVLAYVQWRRKPFLNPIPSSYNPQSPQIFKYQRSEKEEILAYLVSRFGKWADKAIILIGTCENRNFDQFAINTNKDGTKDYGVMQLNQIHIKKYGNLIISDWKSNIDAGYDIFKRSKFKFTAWACNHVISEKGA